MNRRILGLLILVIMIVSPELVWSYAYKKALRVKDGKIISFQQMIAEVNRADMIFVGEQHDNRQNHRAQLDVISSLASKRIPVAIGLEMFRAENQNDVNRWTRGEINADTFLKAYYDNWTLPWSLYKEIFYYSREKRIPMIGLNVPEVISRKISEEGFQSLTSAELKQLPPGITCNVDRDYMDFIKRAYEGHGGTQKSFTNFCEAQMVWDKSMAWRLIDYKKKNPGVTEVVLAGVGHSWKRGIPTQVRSGSGFSTITILPEVPGKLHVKNATVQDADYILLD